MEFVAIGNTVYPSFCYLDSSLIVVLEESQVVQQVPAGIILVELVADIEPRMGMVKIPRCEQGCKIRAQDFRRQGRARFAHCKYPGGFPGRRC